MAGAYRKVTSNVPLTLLPKRRISEEDFVARYSDEDVKAEWVDGKVILIMPDNAEHNELVRFLLHIMDGYALGHNLGVFYVALLQARFAHQKRRRLPDLLFVAKNRLSIVKETYIEGPPDLVVEVVSPDSVSRDYREKFEEYRKAGVREYWIVDPLSKRVELYSLKGAKYTRIAEKSGMLRSKVLPGFHLKPEWLWKRPLPNWLEVLKELGVR